MQAHTQTQKVECYEGNWTRVWGGGGRRRIMKLTENKDKQPGIVRGGRGGDSEREAALHWQRDHQNKHGCILPPTSKGPSPLSPNVRAAGQEIESACLNPQPAGRLTRGLHLRCSAHRFGFFRSVRQRGGEKKMKK